MKNTFLTISAVALLMLTSCYRIDTPNFGFSSPIQAHGTGLTIMAVDRYTDYIYLTGAIELETGSVSLQLLNPDDIAIFDTTLHATTTFNVSEMYDAFPGYWKLKYSSENGTGNIDLHLNY